jgi:hypothetical protein
MRTPPSAVIHNGGRGCAGISPCDFVWYAITPHEFCNSLFLTQPEEVSKKQKGRLSAALPSLRSGLFTFCLCTVSVIADCPNR